MTRIRWELAWMVVLAGGASFISASGGCSAGSATPFATTTTAAATAGGGAAAGATGSGGSGTGGDLFGTGGGFGTQDADGDGIPDDIEGKDAGTDTDMDGTPDYLDTDSDNDSIPDKDEGTEDWDNDGIPNFQDPYNDGPAPPIKLTAITTPFNNPIGIDYHEPTNTVVVSVNWPGGVPLNFERIEFDGSHEPFSNISGLTNEVKIATARSGNPGGFTVGDLFVGNGIDGQIMRISDNGNVVDNPWVDLVGNNNGLMRGSLYVDRTGIFGGDLIAVTTIGEVWRVTAAGAATLIATIGAHLEGAVVVPDSEVRYGPLAGKIIAGAEEEGLLWAIAKDGTFQSYNVGVEIEDIDIISPNENFFGVNFGTGKLIGAEADQWKPLMGDLLLTQEMHSGTGLYRLRWDGQMLTIEELTLTLDSAPVTQWEHVTFAPAGINEIPVVPPPT